MARPPTSIALLIVVAFFYGTSSASALSRAYRPLTILVPEADAIVEAHISTLPPLNPKTDGSTTITVTVDQVLKGEIAKGTTEVAMTSMTRFWGEVQWKEGGHYLLLLKRSESPIKFEITEVGSRTYTDDAAKEIGLLVKNMPAWSKDANGLSTLLTTEVAKYHVDDEINLWIGCRNDSKMDIQFRYTNWPRATSSKWKLEVRKEGGEIIAALPHPTLTAKDIEDYFSKHGRSYDVTLKPGEFHWFILRRVNSAKPGWGYKEELDYQYYPMTAPGKYTISVTAENLLSAGALKAGSVEVTLGK